MPETLAQLVRSKYPGAYDDLDDAALESKVIAAYPGVYDDLPRSSGKRASAPSLAPFNPPRMTVRPSFQKATSAGPMVGATVGGMAGGIPGAALGGAAGRGYEDLIRHAREIPAAVKDVAVNLVNHPRETLTGAAEGMAQGLADTGLAAGANAALEGAGAGAMKLLRTAGTSIYRGYLKPSLAGHAIKDARQIVQTALEEALPISQKGVEKGNALINELKAKVDAILTNRQHISKTLHGDIDLHDVAEDVRSFARDKYYRAGRPPADFEAAMKVADHIDAHPSVPATQARGPQPTDLTGANQTKRTLYESAGDRAFGMERGAAEEAEKRGARSLKERIEYRAPEVGPLNARESKLIDAAKAITRAVEREANQNMLAGVKTMLAAGAGGAEYGRTGDPWSAAAKALALRYALAPDKASQLAIITYHLGKMPGVAPASAARVALAALSEQE